MCSGIRVSYKTGIPCLLQYNDDERDASDSDAISVREKGSQKAS